MLLAKAQNQQTGLKVNSPLSASKKFGQTRGIGAAEERKTRTHTGQRVNSSNYLGRCCSCRTSRETRAPQLSAWQGKAWQKAGIRDRAQKDLELDVVLRSSPRRRLKCSRPELFGNQLPLVLRSATAPLWQHPQRCARKPSIEQTHIEEAPKAT